MGMQGAIGGYWRGDGLRSDVHFVALLWEV